MSPPRGVVVEVYGLPRPAGSKRVFLVGKDRRPVVTDDCKGGPDWRASVQHAIARAYRGAPLLGPLELSLYFTVPRPSGHLGRRGLRPSAPPYPARKPDVTKLVRAVEDAATGLLWHDDAQIVTQAAAKRYGERPGVIIHCRRLEGAEEEGAHHGGSRLVNRRGGDGAARDANKPGAAQANAPRRV